MAQMFEPTTADAVPDVIGQSESASIVVDNKRKKRNETYRRAARMYGTEEQMNAALSENGIDVTSFASASNPTLAKRKLANMAMVAIATEQDFDVVAKSWTSQRKAFSTQLFGKDLGDDEQLYAGMVGFFEKKEAERQMVSQLQNRMFDMVAQKVPYNDAVGMVFKEFRGKPGWDEKAERSGAYHRTTREVYSSHIDQMDRLGPLIDEVFTYYATGAGYRKGAKALASKLNALMPDDAVFVIDAAAAQWKSESERIMTASSGDKSGLLEGGAKIPLRFSRGGEDIDIGAKVELGRAGKYLSEAASPGWFPFWKGDVASDPAIRQEKLERRILANARGISDELKGDNFFTEALLKTFDSLPYTLSAWSIPGMIYAAASMKNDARGELIDSGIDPATADRISTVAAPIMALIERAESAMVLFGKIPGVEKRFGLLKSATLGQFAKRFGARAATVEAGQIAEEFAQDLTTPVVQEVFSWFDKGVSGADLWGSVKDFGKMSPELAISLFLPTLFSAQRGSSRDYNATKTAMAIAEDRDVLIGHGFTAEDADKIATARTKSALEFIDAWDEGEARRNANSEEAKEARERLQAKIDAQKIPEGLSVTGNEDAGYSVTDENAKVVAQAPTAEEAAEQVKQRSAQAEDTPPAKDTESAPTTAAFWNDAYSKAEAKGLNVMETDPKTGKIKIDPKTGEPKIVKKTGAEASQALKDQNRIAHNLQAVLDCLRKK